MIICSHPLCEEEIVCKIKTTITNLRLLQRHLIKLKRSIIDNTRFLIFFNLTKLSMSYIFVRFQSYKQCFGSFLTFEEYICHMIHRLKGFMTFKIALS